MIGGGDADGVDRLVVQDLAEVDVPRRPLALPGVLLHGREAEVQVGLVGIGNRGDLHVVQPAKAVEVALAASAQVRASATHANHGDSHGIAGASENALRGGEGGRRTHQKMSSFHECSLGLAPGHPDGQRQIPVTVRYAITFRGAPAR